MYYNFICIKVLKLPVFLKERNFQLKKHSSHLQKVVGGLRDEGVALLKDRVSFLGCSTNHSNDLLFKVRICVEVDSYVSVCIFIL